MNATVELPEILDELTDDGDTVELDDGRTLRLRIESSDESFLFVHKDGTLDTNDECYGTFAFYDTRERNCGSYGYPVRPDGFDGNAEVLRSNGGDPLWWQPPTGDYALIDPDTGKPARRGSDTFRQLRSHVLDLLEFGYSAVGVEVLDGKDAYGRPIVVNHAWIGYVEPEGYATWKDTLRGIVSDLLAELGIGAA